MLAVPVTGQAQDQVLLGPSALQVQELFLLGTLVERQGNLQAAVLGFELGHRGRQRVGRDVFNHQEVAAQQVTVVLFVSLA